ncbi:MAG: hypothetical protein HFG27_08375 [Provencibacterium sp.]|nr:hypothetical protein [Provencibacterium sp.]
MLEASEYRKRQHETIQRLIPIVIEGMTDEMWGKPTTEAVIAVFEEGIKYLERSALQTDPADYLDDRSSDKGLS